jgi:hypothetical protein
MDGLALLCTLHADGPQTLKRLRGAGCADLTALLELPITELALALEVAPGAQRLEPAQLHHDTPLDQPILAAIGAQHRGLAGIAAIDGGNRSDFGQFHDDSNQPNRAFY